MQRVLWKCIDALLRTFDALTANTKGLKRHTHKVIHKQNMQISRAVSLSSSPFLQFSLLFSHSPRSSSAIQVMFECILLIYS